MAHPQAAPPSHFSFIPCHPSLTLVSPHAMSGGGSTTSVWVKLVRDVKFAWVSLPGTSVADVAELACTKFAHWQLNALQIHIHLVAECGTAVPTPAAIAAALAQAPLVESAAVTTGAWLVAVPIPAGGGSSSAPPRDPVALLSALLPVKLDARQEELLRSHIAFDSARQELEAGLLKATQVTRLLQTLRSVATTSSTQAEQGLASGIVLDGPLSGAVGQNGTSFKLALWKGEALCAKVSSRAAMAHEWVVSQAIHVRSCAPTVARALALEDLPPLPEAPSALLRSLLLLPLLPLSAAIARMAFAPQRDAPRLPAAALRCRDALAAKVALCGLAGIAAFARAGWAHGDIKPGNIMLSHGSAAGPSPCVLIDFGAAQPVGTPLAEHSHFGLHFPPTASLAYDLACLASTVALMQYDLPMEVGRGTGAELLAALHGMDAAAQAGEGASEAGRPPGSLAAEACLRLAQLAAQGHVQEAGLRQAAEDVAAASSQLALPSVDALWPRDL